MVQEAKMISQDGRKLCVLKIPVELMRQDVDFSFFYAWRCSLL